jgi:uncharacterized membrane protein YtjA (UPF0391 family)
MVPVVLLITALVAAFTVSGSIAGAAGRIVKMELWMVSILLLLTVRFAAGSEGKTHWPKRRGACQPVARGAVGPMPTQSDYTVLTAAVVAARGEDLRLTRHVAATEGEAERIASVVAGPVAGAAGPVVTSQFSFCIVK